MERARPLFSVSSTILILLGIAALLIGASAIFLNIAGFGLQVIQFSFRFFITGYIFYALELLSHVKE